MSLEDDHVSRGAQPVETVLGVGVECGQLSGCVGFEGIQRIARLCLLFTHGLESRSVAVPARRSFAGRFKGDLLGLGGERLGELVPLGGLGLENLLTLTRPIVLEVAHVRGSGRRGSRHVSTELGLQGTNLFVEPGGLDADGLVDDLVDGRPLPLFDAVVDLTLEDGEFDGHRAQEREHCHHDNARRHDPAPPPRDRVVGDDEEAIVQQFAERDHEPEQDGQYHHADAVVPRPRPTPAIHQEDDGEEARERDLFALHPRGQQAVPVDAEVVEVDQEIPDRLSTLQALEHGNYPSQHSWK